MIKPKIVFFYALLHGFLVLNSGAEWQVEDPNQCAGFCFRAVLNHMFYRQGLGSNLNDSNRQASELRLENIEKQLAAQHQILTSLASSQGTSQKNIPKNFEKIGSGFYYIEQYHKANWFAAGELCRRMGGHLASISNETELNAIKAQLTTSTEYWLDINSLGDKDVYMSSTSGNKASFLKWASGEPSNTATDHCVLFNNLMYDRTCEQLTLFICEAGDDE
ncbi:C-type lectin 37Db-like [Drosophila elegans]|uniref:C-type lectin 37Db-like n=1 Tax=Drosophila elegans TaxID=30023 RepID=UPI0007E7C998|nr:C-type lectin 37Db-like [Drosophila elegans]